MPATPANAIRATREAKIIKLADSAIQSDYPNARDALLDPEPGYFNDADDALDVLEAKQELIGEPRRRFIVSVGEIVNIDPTTGIPGFQLIDAELGLNLPVMVTRAEVDFENETTALEVIG